MAKTAGVGAVRTLCVRLALRRGSNDTLVDAGEEIVLSACDLLKIMQIFRITWILLFAATGDV